MLRWNSKWLLRKPQKMLWGYFILLHPVGVAKWNRQFSNDQTMWRLNVQIPAWAMILEFLLNHIVNNLETKRNFYAPRRRLLTISKLYFKCCHKLSEIYMSKFLRYQYFVYVHNCYQAWIQDSKSFRPKSTMRLKGVNLRPNFDKQYTYTAKLMQITRHSI